MIGGCVSDWVGASCGLHQAEGLGVDSLGGLLVLDFAVDGDAAADAVAVALGDDVGAGRGCGGRQRERPRQRDVLHALRLGVEIEVVDGRHGPRRPKIS